VQYRGTAPVKGVQDDKRLKPESLVVKCEVAKPASLARKVVAATLFTFGFENKATKVLWTKNATGFQKSVYVPLDTLNDKKEGELVTIKKNSGEDVPVACRGLYPHFFETTLNIHKNRFKKFPNVVAENTEDKVVQFNNLRKRNLITFKYPCKEHEPKSWVHNWKNPNVKAMFEAYNF